MSQEILKNGWLRKVEMFREKTRSDLSDLQKEVLKKDSDWIKYNKDDEILKKEKQEIKSITREEYDVLRKKNVLTDEEIRQLVKFSNTDGSAYLELNITTITDRQAELLSEVKYDYVILDWLTTITDKQAEQFGKIKEFALRWLRRITNKQAKELWKATGIIDLSWLEGITEEQAKELSKATGILSLDWLTKITDEQARYLGKVDDLSLNWLTTMTDEQAKLLSYKKSKYKRLSLNWLTSITDKQAEIFSEIYGLQVFWLKEITEKQAKNLKKITELNTSNYIYFKIQELLTG